MKLKPKKAVLPMTYYTLPSFNISHLVLEMTKEYIYLYHPGYESTKSLILPEDFAERVTHTLPLGSSICSLCKSRYQLDISKPGRISIGL